MNKNYKVALLISSTTILGIWLLSPASNPIWIKHLIFILVFLLQAILFAIFGLKKKFTTYFGLTEKLYSVMMLLAMSIYLLGIDLITPNTDPIWLKHSILGGAILLMFVVALYLLFKPITEKADERFYNNLGKSAVFLLLLLLALFLIVSILTIFFPITLSVGMILVGIGLLLEIFIIIYFVLEKRGA